MNISAMKEAAVRSVHLGLLFAKRHSPVILTGAGIVGGVTSTVLACRATLKVQPVIEDLNDFVDDVNSRKIESSYRRGTELGYIYGTYGIKIARIYAPAVIVGVASVGCVLGSHVILRRRNAALVAAYAALDQSFNEYRKRIREEIGDKRENEIRNSLVERNVVDAETGEKTKKLVVDGHPVSIYAKFFDELNPNWTKTHEYNILFLRSQMRFANDRLRVHGHIFLNEVYDMLGIKRTPAGQIVGWVYGGDGDDFVDFGLDVGDREAVREFVNGYERGILLDFNVDGVIQDMI